MLRCILWIPLILLMLPFIYLAQKFPVSLPDPEDSNQGRVPPDREHHAAVPGQLAQLGGGEGGDTGHS